MCDNCKEVAAHMSNDEMLDLISTFFHQKQESMNKVLNDYFKAQSRIHELEQENAKLKEELAKYEIQSKHA